MARGIIPFRSMRDLEGFFDDFNFGRFGGDGFVPAVDVYQDKDNVIANVSIAGIDPEKVSVSIENDVLTISGQTEEKEEMRRENYYRKEIREGAFTRSIILPMRVKGELAEAHYEKGILKIIMPKSEEAKPKTIAVKIK